MLAARAASVVCRRSFFATKHANALTNKFVKVDDSVNFALNNGKPVVALESTIITHGMPYPENMRTAVEVESIVRSYGVVPATIAVVDGIIHVGLDNAKLHRLATSENAVKLSRRDLAMACSMRFTGGTTVSATMLIAHWYGIDIFVTGGIGGVHRMGQDSLDISTDLTELGRTPVTVVSAGVKSILDIQRTLEFLETQGVTVATLGDTTDFPAFFTRKSGHHAPFNISSVDQAASLIHAQKQLKLNSGILLSAPIPQDFSACGEKIEQAIAEAVEKCRQMNVSGKAVTPFILKHINETTGGKSLQSNIALIRNNAEIGAQLAKKLNELENNYIPKPIKSTETNPRRPVVVGGCNIDIVSKSSSDILLRGPSNPAVISQEFGGVGRNIAETLWRLNDSPQMISLVGDDRHGELMLGHLNAMDLTSISVARDQRTGVYIGVHDDNGELYVAIQDSSLYKANADFIKAHESDILHAPIVCLDANVSEEVVEYVCFLCSRHEIPLLFEPTGDLVAARAFQAAGKYREAISFMTPNIGELKAIYESTTELPAKEVIEGLQNGEVINMCKPLLETVPCIMVTLGSEGVLSGTSQGNNPVFHHYAVDTLPPWTWLKQPVANVSGSGDGFAAGFAHGILNGYNTEESIQIGITIAQRNLRSLQTVSKETSEREACAGIGAWKGKRIA